MFTNVVELSPLHTVCRPGLRLTYAQVARKAAPETVPKYKKIASKWFESWKSVYSRQIQLPKHYQGNHAICYEDHHKSYLQNKWNKKSTKIASVPKITNPAKSCEILKKHKLVTKSYKHEESQPRPTAVLDIGYLTSSIVEEGIRISLMQILLERSTLPNVVCEINNIIEKANLIIILSYQRMFSLMEERLNPILEM